MPARKDDGQTKRFSENDDGQRDETTPLLQRLKPVRDKIAARPKTGLEADKAFFDEMSGDY